MSKVQDILKENGHQPKETPPVVPPANGAPPATTPPAKEGAEPPVTTPPVIPPANGSEGAPPPVTTPPTQEAVVPPVTTPPVNDDLDDAVLLAALKKKGHNIESLDDIKKPAKVLTPEQEQVALQERQDAMRQFALKNKIATSTQFDNYIKETNIPPIDMAFLLYRQERLQELQGKDVKPEDLPNDVDLRAEFDEAHHQYADESDPKRIRAEKLLTKSVDDYINDKYENIVSLEDSYTAHETEKQLKTTYREVVKDVIGKLGTTLEFIIEDGKDKVPVKFNIPQQLLTKLEQNYLADVSFNAFGKNNVSNEVLLNAMKGNIIAENFNDILKEGALTYFNEMFEKIPKGRRGILPLRETGSEGGGKAENKTVKAILGQSENQKILNR